MSLPVRRFGQWVALALVVLAISACGGGGDGGGSSSGNQNDQGGGSSNSPPKIQGQPAGAATASETYSFQPSASDPNGDQLTFTATNVPAWASFNRDTGRLSGTPSAADVGTYDGIVITVSDGTRSTSLDPFSITVSELGIGAATLSWMPPTENADGTTLVDLAGYQIRYGKSSDDLSQVVELDNPALNVYVIESLSAGTWYFAVSAVNSSGVTSDLSNVASKTIG
jgi:hypothetical protein